MDILLLVDNLVVWMVGLVAELLEIRLMVLEMEFQDKVFQVAEFQAHLELDMTHLVAEEDLRQDTQEEILLEILNGEAEELVLMLHLFLALHLNLFI